MSNLLSEYENEQYVDMVNTISDLAKDAYGTRSACPDVTGMSFKELSDTYESMIVDLVATNKAEKEYQDERVKEFEATVESLIENGAGNRETALRWLFEADVDFDPLFDTTNYFEYTNGLPYGYLKVEG